MAKERHAKGDSSRLFISCDGTLLSGILFASTATLLIAVTAGNLARFQIVGQTRPFAYPWRLVESDALARVTAWCGYALHNTVTWYLIWYAKANKGRFTGTFDKFNWLMAVNHVVFFLLHLLQTHLYYDGLAVDVPEITAMGSMVMMLMVVVILKNPSRGLFWGKRLSVTARLGTILREYHGYMFSWALVYTFWYHPTTDTTGHLWGFFYILLLIWQSVLIFNRGHLNRWWRLSLELLVIPHGAFVAAEQPYGLWSMFVFGFGSVFVLIQMHGLPLHRRTRKALLVVYVVATFCTYALLGRLAVIHEVLRIPVIYYLVVLFIALPFYLYEKLRLVQN